MPPVTRAIAPPAGGGTLLSFQGAGLPGGTVERFHDALSRLGVSEANLALLERNAGVAGEIAAALASPG